MGSININDLNEEMTISEEELKHVKGGIALLLPAVQKVREAAARTDHKEWIVVDSVAFNR